MKLRLMTPVIRATKFEFMLNLKTANSLDPAS